MNWGRNVEKGVDFNAFLQTDLRWTEDEDAENVSEELLVETSRQFSAISQEVSVSAKVYMFLIWILTSEVRVTGRESEATVHKLADL